MEIKKINDSEIFDKIKTGITDINELPMIVRKSYQTWQNKLDTHDDDMVWVGEDPHLIIDLIERQNYKQASKRIHYEALANILLALDKERFKKFVSKLYTIGIVIQQNIPIGDNELSNSERNNYIDYNDIIDIRDKIFATVNLKNNLSHLILSLNTYIPPIRLDYLGMIYKIMDIDPVLDPSDKKNYMWINEETNCGYIVLNHDKVGSTILPLADFKSKFKDELYINGSKLFDIIFQSYKIYPRDYLLCSPKNLDTQMGISTYNSILKQLLKKDVRQNIFRKAYINHWHDTEQKLTENELRIIATYMRHSVSTARFSYRKIIEDVQDSPHEDLI